MKKFKMIQIGGMLILFFLLGMVLPVSAHAQVQNITLENGSTTQENSDYSDGDYYMVGDTGQFELSYTDWWWQGEMVKKEFQSSNPSVVRVDEEGNYVVLAGGRADIRVTGWNEQGEIVFQASYRFEVCSDVSKTTLKTSSVQAYLFPQDYSACTTDEVTVPLVNAPDFTYYKMDYVTDNTYMGITCQFDEAKKAFSFKAFGTGTGTVTITLNGKVFQVILKVKEVKIKKTSAILIKKQNLKLTIKGYSGGIKWISTNKKAATVSAKGSVKAKKTGNAVIYAKIGNHKIGCAVSVVTSKMKRVINKAKKIAKTCKYSQAKRMSAKYYDCSSLVWKSYRTVGKTFGNKNYAPVAADLAKWCSSHKKMIKGGASESNIRKMKLRPGDLLFQTGSDNGRYKGIYHVEMFVGYRCYGFYENKPILGTLWAARGEGYGIGATCMARS